MVLVGKGVVSNPSLIMFQSIKGYRRIYCCEINYMYRLVYGAISRFAREIGWVEITLTLYVKQSRILDKNMFVM